MSQIDTLTADVAALQTAAASAEAAIASELAVISAGWGANPDVATAITNIEKITSALTVAANTATASIPAPAPAATAGAAAAQAAAAGGSST